MSRIAGSVGCAGPDWRTVRPACGSRAAARGKALRGPTGQPARCRSQCAVPAASRPRAGRRHPASEAGPARWLERLRPDAAYGYVEVRPILDMSGWPGTPHRRTAGHRRIIHPLVPGHRRAPQDRRHLADHPRTQLHALLHGRIVPGRPGSAALEHLPATLRLRTSRSTPRCSGRRQPGWSRRGRPRDSRRPRGSGWVVRWRTRLPRGSTAARQR